MKNYNSCDDVKQRGARKSTGPDKPANSLLRGEPKESHSASAALLVAVLEIVVGAILLFPGILGIIYSHYGLIAYGCYGVLMMVFGVLGSIGVKKHVYILVFTFYVWKYVTVMLVLGITVAVIVMVIENVVPEVNNLWFSTIIIGGLGVVFELWSVGGILWTRPFWLDVRDLSSAGSSGSAPDDLDMTMISKDPEPESLPPPPLVGVAPVEDPMKTAVRLFNKNPDNGIRYLTDHNLIDDSFKDIAQFLHTMEDINSSKLGEFLGENKPFNIGVLRAFVDYFDFSNLEFDNALRDFLSRFRLPGEAQKIDRIMECFAERFHTTSPGIFPDADTAYLLAFSLIMLNTDLHNPAIKHKMSKKAFVANNTGIRGKDDVPISYLEMLYDKIMQNEIKMEADGLFTRAAFRGWLEKRSTRKKWQRRWFVLKNNCLYYFSTPDDENPRVIIPLEGLLIRKLEHATTSTAPMATSNIFEIIDPYQRTIKSVKISTGGPTEGNHERFVLMAISPEEADEWVNTLQNNVLGNPVLQLIKKRKGVVVQKLAATAQPQVTLPPTSVEDIDVTVSTSLTPPIPSSLSSEADLPISIPISVTTEDHDNPL